VEQGIYEYFWNRGNETYRIEVVWIRFVFVIVIDASLLCAFTYLPWQFGYEASNFGSCFVIALASILHFFIIFAARTAALNC